MSPLQSAFESCSREPEPSPRVEHRRGAREQFGLCLCGTPVAWHFDTRNHRLACDHPSVIAARLRTVLQQAHRRPR